MLFAHLIRPYRAKYVIGFAMLFVVDAINVGLPLVVRYAIDSLPQKRAEPLLLAALLYLVLMILQAVGRYAWRMYLMGSSHRIARDLRVKLFSHLQRIPTVDFQKSKTGDYMSRATNDVESVRMAVGPGLLVAADALLIFILIVPVMWWLSPKMTLLTFAFYPAVPWLTVKLGGQIETLFDRLQKHLSHLSSFAQEVFTGIRWVKSLVLESNVQTRFAALSKGYADEGRKLAVVEAIFSPGLTLLTECGTVLILFIGGNDVLKGAITIGTFVAFQRFVVQLAWPMEAIGWAVTMLKEGKAAEKRIDDILRIAEIKAPQNQTEISVASGALEIRDLNFTYAGQSRPALTIKSIFFSPGKKVGMVGAVGAGKSTLFQLILKIYEPSVGNIFWKGEDITTLPSSELRKQITCVEQDVFLFGESIVDNLGIGMKVKPTSEEIGKVLEFVSLKKEIDALPRGKETRLGERGVSLSGGQRQRVALARALIRKPQLLLLDDSFSAVDVGVERQIIENLLKSDLALCIASHRLAIMPLLDEVLVLSQGTILDRGKHTDLLRRCSHYVELWEKSKSFEDKPVGAEELVWS